MEEKRGTRSKPTGARNIRGVICQTDSTVCVDCMGDKCFRSAGQECVLRLGEGM